MPIASAPWLAAAISSPPGPQPMSSRGGEAPMAGRSQPASWASSRAGAARTSRVRRSACSGVQWARDAKTCCTNSSARCPANRSSSARASSRSRSRSTAESSSNLKSGIPPPRSARSGIRVAPPISGKRASHALQVSASLWRSSEPRQRGQTQGSFTGGPLRENGAALVSLACSRRAMTENTALRESHRREVGSGPVPSRPQCLRGSLAQASALASVFRSAP